MAQRDPMFEQFEEMKRSEESTPRLPLSHYQMQPDLDKRFQSLTVKELIQEVLSDFLSGKSYSRTEVPQWTKDLSDSIRDKVKELRFSRYKYVVQVVMGEQNGAGLRAGSRCLWDAGTDDCATDTFTNETIFCMAVVFAVYHY